MPGLQVQQAKLQFVAIAPETTIGTFVALSPGTTYARQMVTDHTIEASEGTRIIARDDVGDGYAGSPQGAIGSFGYGVQFTTEIHSEANTGVPSLVKLLAACGHYCDGVIADTEYICTPSTVPLASYPAAPTPYDTDIPPCALSVVRALLDGDSGSVDAARVVASAVGSHVLTLPAAGERITFQFAGQGNLPASALVVDGLSGLASLGSTPGTGRPAVWRGGTISVSSATGTYDVAEIRNVVLTQGANVVATDRPQATWGRGVPSVFLDSAPTLAFELASTRGDLPRALGDWLGGITLALQFVIDAGNQSITLDIPRAEIRDVVVAETDGKRSLQVQCACVRPAASATAPYTYTITDVTP